MWFFLSFRNLWRNPRRTFVILITVIMGTGALFTFDGFINGVLKELKYDTIHSNYGHGQINTLGYRESALEDPIKHWIDNRYELEGFLREIKEIKQIFPRVSFSALLKSDRATVSGSGQGIDAREEAKFFHSLEIKEGTVLTGETQGIVLGEGLAKALDVRPNDPIKIIATTNKGYLKKDTFWVTGIFQTGSKEFDARMFRIQLPAAQKLLKTDRIEQITLGLQSDSDWPSVQNTIEASFPNLEATSFDVLDQIYYQHSVDWLKAQFSVVQIIILSIVVLGIFNSISASILERKQEIGNLRANGESVFSILCLVLTEGGLLAFLGSLIGVIGAYGFLNLLVQSGLTMPPGPGQTCPFLVTFSFKWSTVLLTLILSICSALIASFLASFKIAKGAIAKTLQSH